MEQKTEQQQQRQRDALAALEQKLQPPVHADISAVLNGVGNGAMVTGVPLILWNVLQDAEHQTAKAQKHNKVAFAVTAAGAVIGAVFGFVEAKRTREYREGFMTEIAKLRVDVDAHAHKIDQWSEKESARKAEPAVAAAGR